MKNLVLHTNYPDNIIKLYIDMQGKNKRERYTEDIVLITSNL